MKRNTVKKIVTTLVVSAVAAAAMPVSASACTSIYVGGDRIEEGTPFVARTEDYGSDMNKMWFISENGAFKKGETYTGCPAYGGFEWEFSHDSYRFTYFTNDTLYDGVCPECGEGSKEAPATHFSYTEFGTNEKGVSVSATETIFGNEAVTEADPYKDSEWAETNNAKAGIEETDIPTVILAEADSARDGVELLADIYENRGAVYASGVFICDQNEVWYIENCSGSQYIGVKLNNDMIFIEPNMSIIGSIDLDDEDNVIASDNLIAVAKKAGTFVGDEDKNIIDYRASYSYIDEEMDGRMVEGLNFLNSGYDYDGQTLTDDNDKFTISNVDKAGNIVPLYTAVEADRQLTKDDVFNFYKLSTVGKPSNQEIEIFQLFPDRDTETGTVGWVGVGNMANNVFVPYYPMLIDEIYEGYQVPTAVAQRSEEKPDGFCTWKMPRGEGKGMYVEYPENWRDSYYFCFEGLGGYIKYAEEIDGQAVSEEKQQYVKDELAALQNSFYEDFVTAEELENADDARTLATQNGMDMAKRAQETALRLIDYVKN